MPGRITRFSILIALVGLTWGAAAVSASPTDPAKAKAEHWAYQPVANPAAPKVKAADRVRDPIDAFVLARIEATPNIDPAPEADRRTLIRRLYFDLIGLPPTYEQVEAFVNDTSADAYEKVVDGLLAMPRFGERWGRHWLDVTRYADTIGYDGGGRERKFPFSWTYRDYVIRAFNSDKPYDRFILEQIAADRLGLGANDPNLAALGMLTVGRQFLGNRDSIVDDQIDVITRGMMGMTVQCARCHDHKFEAVPTTDYYALHGVFYSISTPEPLNLPVVGEAMGSPEQKKAYQAELARRNKAIDDHLAGVRNKVTKEAGDRADEYLRLVKGEVENINHVRHRLRDHFSGAWRRVGSPRQIDEPTKQKIIADVRAKVAAQPQGFFDQGERDKYNNLRGRIIQLQLQSAGAPPRAMIVTDGAPHNPYVYVRGQRGNRGEKVGRRWLSVLGGDPFSDHTGRLEFARKVAAPNNPLTARVWVNRVWMHLFGEGIVRTPGDFGDRGERPTHPLLLDHLATRFVADGWSTKKLIRNIVLSGTYRLASAGDPRLDRIDPENRLLARQNRRRLGFEPLRDAVLVVANKLDRSMYGRPVHLFGNKPSHRRAVYGFIDRQDLPQTLRAFDFASPDHSTPHRLETTVPQQALFMMNSPFVLGMADAAVARASAGADTDAKKIVAAYRVILSRDPSPVEVAAAYRYIRGEPAGEAWRRFGHALMQSNEFAFID